MSLTKREVRERVRELNALMADWDPTGVIADSHAPRDEYECLVGPLLTLLQSGAGEPAIRRYLSDNLSSTLGCPQTIRTSRLSQLGCTGGLNQ